MHQLLCLAASMIALSAGARAEAPFDFDHAPGQLPKTVVPESYRIDITPDLEKLTLTGRETIALKIRAPTATITMNEAGLTLGSATLENGSAATFRTDTSAQTVTLVFPKPVAAGAHTLTIAYTGPVPETPNGIYHDDYKTPSGTSKRMLVTQFEVADARRMFPGWDEPAFKATFQLSVTLPRDLAAISNMPVASTTAIGTDKKHIAFATTPRMSTYLLALVAGDLAALHGSAGGTQMNVWAPTGEEDQGAYALSVEKNVLPFYNSYFGVDYPLPKLDLIAIPGNYLAGAMENWGAITYVDDALLFDPKTSSPHTRDSIHVVVAHEMAHQWSGDLVTMGWWDNIWLNEGFATWMSHKATDHFNPTWEVWPREHESREEAMGQDALPTTHPIQQVIRDESQASSAFDEISYQKGEQIIRMVEDWISPDTFRDGMRLYMKAHQFGNSTSADLWAALGAASHRDVARIAAGFTEQPGIPLVHVARVCDNGKGEIRLTQDRFTIHDPHPKPQTWLIPFSLGGPGLTPRHVLLTADPLVIAEQAACSNAPIKANLGENGYYRVQYDAVSLKALSANFTKLQAVDRANLLGDEFALFAAGRAPLTEYLDLASNLAVEHSVAVWENNLYILRRLDRALPGSPLQPAYHAFAVKLIRPEFNRLGWDGKPGESFLDSLLRPKLIEALGRYGDAEIVAEAGRRFKLFVQNPNSLDGALRDPVLGIVGHHADQATYDTLKALGIKAATTEEKTRYFSAMADAADPRLIRQGVAFAGANQVPNGRLPEYIQELSFGSGAPDMVFGLIQPQEDALNKRLPPDNMTPNVLVSVAFSSNNPAIAKALLADKTSDSSSGAHVWALRAADMIGNAADLRLRTQDALKTWLKQE